MDLLQSILDTDEGINGDQPTRNLHYHQWSNIGQSNSSQVWAWVNATSRSLLAVS